MVQFSSQPENRVTHVLRVVALWLAAVLYIFLATEAAAMDRQDLTVGMKTLPLLNNKITGSIKIAILYDSGKSASMNEAEDIKAIIDGGLDLPGDLTAEGVLVPATQPEKMAGSKIAIVTSNLGDFYDRIDAAAGKYSILTMSTDLECVRENKCILGIVSGPPVAIYYSRHAAENAKISFGQAFLTLVKQVPY